MSLRSEQWGDFRERGRGRETKGVKRRRREKEKPGAFCEHVVFIVEAVTR